MDLNEFRQAVLADEITNFEPYFREGTFDQITSRKAICIECGAAQEFYSEWARPDYPNKNKDWVQLWLATNGYCLDILSKTDDEDIILQVIKHNLNYALDDNCRILTNYRHFVYCTLMEAKKTPQNVLNKYLETHDNEHDDSALELKREAMQITPTIIEKTMTPMQLYTARNPLWTTNLTGYQTQQVLNSTAGILELRKILNERK